MSLARLIGSFDESLLSYTRSNQGRNHDYIPNITEYLKNKNWREEAIIWCENRTDRYDKILPSYSDSKVRVIVLCNTKKRVTFLKSLQNTQPRHVSIHKNRLQYVNCVPSTKLSHLSHPRLVTTMSLLKYFGSETTDAENVILSMKYDILIIDCGLRTLLHDLYYTSVFDNKAVLKRFARTLRLLMHRCSKVVFTNDRYAPTARQIEVFQHFVQFKRTIHLAKNPLCQTKTKKDGEIISNNKVTVTICYSNMMDLMDNVIKDGLPFIKNEPSSYRLEESTIKDKEFTADFFTYFVKHHRQDSRIREGDFTCKLIDTLTTSTKTKEKISNVMILGCGKHHPVDKITDLLTVLATKSNAIKIKKLYSTYAEKQRAKRKPKFKLTDDDGDVDDEDDYPVSCSVIVSSLEASLAKAHVTEVTVTTIQEYPEDVLENTDILFIYVDDKVVKNTSLFKLLHLTRGLSNCEIYLFVRQYKPNNRVKQLDEYSLDVSLNLDIPNLNFSEKRALLSKERWYEKIFAVSMTYPHTSGNIKYYGTKEGVNCNNELYDTLLTCFRKYITKSTIINRLSKAMIECYKLPTITICKLINSGAERSILSSISGLIALFSKPDKFLVNFIKSLNYEKLSTVLKINVSKKCVEKKIFNSVLLNPLPRCWGHISSYAQFKSHCRDVMLLDKMSAADLSRVIRQMEKRVPMEIVREELKTDNHGISSDSNKILLKKYYCGNNNSKCKLLTDVNKSCTHRALAILLYNKI